MAAGYDIGASFASSSGAQGGTAKTGDFIVGGSGGANKTPAWLLAVMALAVVILLFKVLVPSKR